MNPNEPKVVKSNEFSNEPRDLVALLELRELVASELDDLASQDQLKRTFRPLTDGLGLESPKRKEIPPEPVRPTPRTSVTVKPASVVFGDRSEVETAPSHASAPSLASVMVRPEPEATLQDLNEIPARQPPPMPRSSIFRRFFSAILDELFVLSLFTLALGLTLHLLSGGGFNFSFASIRNFQNPFFFRFAVMEFATLWLSYFAICVGILDMTFGMWVWGIRISYGKGDGESKSLRKICRIILSFLFYAPIFPLAFLAISRKGKNLLDLLSQTSLYRTVL
jgi:uncharacterized RDD family membrane protein YckC